MFIKVSSGEIFNVLLKGDFGAWVISFDEPGAPVLIENEVLSSAERIESPKKYVDAALNDRSIAAEKRYQLIKPLLDDMNCICDSAKRIATAELIAKAEHTTKERVLRLYYKYLATGALIENKPREHKPKSEFDKAIRKYYFSAKRNSLRTTYELMLLDNYTDFQGKLMGVVPSFDAFRMYYYRNWSKNPQKDISRDGLGDYLRNKRPLYGCAMNYRKALGSYAIDAATADIHVVSSFDRTKPIGRPNIYLAIDYASQLITGVYVGMDSGEDALLKCIANTACDKKKYCEQLGIEISAEDWPTKGLPFEIISDRGGEFCSDRLTELTIRYGVELNINAPFRPDLKSIVERNIGLLQESYSSLMAGKGLIGPDAYERWAVDYRSQAVLTLEEYRKIVVLSIIAINKRTIEDICHIPVEAGNTPLSIWNWHQKEGMSNILAVNEEEVYIRALPRKSAKYERKGIIFRKLRYIPASGEVFEVGKRYTFAYDMDNTSCIYVLGDGKEFIRFNLSDSCSRYDDMSYSDAEHIRSISDSFLTDERKIETEARVKLRQNMQYIVEMASLEKENCYEVQGRR